MGSVPEGVGKWSMLGMYRTGYAGGSVAKVLLDICIAEYCRTVR